MGSGRLLDREQEQGIRQAIETKTPQELEIPSAYGPVRLFES